MQEIWKQYRDTVYEVSNTGYVRNSTTNKILSPTITRQNYFRLTIWHHKKSFATYVHRVVAEAFIENPENKAIVNHLDGNPSNNRLDNLEWTTISENVRHAYETGLAKRGEDSVVSKLTEADVFKIIQCMKDGDTVAQTARLFKMSSAAISNIWNGNTWKHIKRDKPETKNYKGKLKVTDIPVIRKMFVEGKTNKQIADIYGIHPTSIYNIRFGKNWTNY